jgi:hypothetical protein
MVKVCGQQSSEASSIPDPGFKAGFKGFKGTG